MSRQVILLPLIAMATLSACKDPEVSAREAVDKVGVTLAAERTDLDPQKKLAAYTGMVADLQDVVKKYPKTKVAEAISAGRSVGSVSPAELKREQEVLTQRATCYAEPTATCLRPFSSHPNGGAAAASTRASAGTAGGGSPARSAEAAICAKGFAAADAALAPIKINKAAYKHELVQVGLAAAKCDRPDQVKQAIGALVASLPPGDPQRTNALFGILATPALRPAWRDVAELLESDLGGGRLSGNAAATVTLTLALDYARMGDAKAALAKYRYFTDTLHYRADAGTAQQIASAVMADGDIDAGIEISGGKGNPDLYAVALHNASVALGNRMGLVNEQGTVQIDRQATPDIAAYFHPPGTPVDAGEAPAVATLEAALDKFAPTARRSNQTVGIIGIDADYGVMALAHQRLGEADKAKAAIGKAVAYRTHLLGSVDGGSDYASFTAYPALIDIAQGRFEEAATYIAQGRLSSDSFGAILMREVGRTKDAEQALSVVNIIAPVRDGYACYADLIPQMAKAGKSAEVEKLIGAWAGNPAQKANFQWLVIEGMIAAGNADGARTYATNAKLIEIPRDRLRLDSELLQAPAIASDRAKAEPVIRDMFAVGTDLDKGGVKAGLDGLAQSAAQQAATAAFANGYPDLGIELYRKLPKRDQRPLLAAFDKPVPKADMTKVLMLAQNTLTGQPLAYVVDHAILSLQAREAK